MQTDTATLSASLGFVSRAYSYAIFGDTVQHHGSMHGLSCFDSHFRARSVRALQEELLTMRDRLPSGMSGDGASFEQRPAISKCSMLEA